MKMTAEIQFKQQTGIAEWLKWSRKLADLQTGLVIKIKKESMHQYQE